MYHDVVEEPPAAGGGPERFSVTRTSFEGMLDVIANAGRRGCSLAVALEGEPSQVPVAITFDDGTLGQFAHAFPALADRGMSATFFVTTDWVGRPGFMDWGQLRELVSAGMSVQSHTRSHPHLSELGHDEVWAELVQSKEALDEKLDQETTQIALPGGNAPRPRLRPLFGRAGYHVVATSRWGVNRYQPSRKNPTWIRRCTVPRDPDPEVALRIIEGDAWLTAVRYPREAALNGLRAVLGADRYARVRRRFLDGISGS